MKRLELLLLAIQVPLDFFLLLLAGISAYGLRLTPWMRSIRPVLFHLTLGEYVLMLVPIILLWLVIFALSGLYRIDKSRRLATDITRIIVACSAGLSLIALYFLFNQVQFDSRFLIAVGWFLAIVYSILGRLGLKMVTTFFYRTGILSRRVLLLGPPETNRMFQDLLEQRKELGYSIAGSFSAFEDAKRLGALSLEVDELWYTDPRNGGDDALLALMWCGQHHRVFQYSADLFGMFAANRAIHPIAGVPMVEIKRTRLEGWGRVLKRLCDIVGSILFLVFAFPIFFLTALIIFCETGRPILYMNERVGYHGKHFFTLKFRSMYQKDCTGIQFGKSGEDATIREATLIAKQSIKDGPIYKIADDPRVTPFGRWIRRWSIDEFPQMINVLKGDMSIVGPRPHQPREVARYAPEHSRLFTIKPGVTGLSQISGRSDLSFDEEVRLDILYMEQWSLWLDIIVLLKTPFSLFERRSAL